MKRTCCLLICLTVVISLACPRLRGGYADALAEGQAREKVQPVIPLKARAFRLEDVRLFEGPFKHDGA